MPWSERDKMSLKKEFITLARQSGVNRRELIRRFGISAPTAYKWLNRYEVEGESGLSERSRRPHRSPLLTSEKVESLIVELRKEKSYWGPRKIKRVLENRGHTNIPSVSTVHSIIKRNGLLSQSPTRTKAYERFERSEPNELWQMDFKGYFHLKDRRQCHPLTVCDDHSRFNILLKACENQQTQTVQSHLHESFMLYGLPDAILCDNGSPWGYEWGSDIIGTRLEMWLIRLGVKMYHGRPYHPQTQGKEERFHKTLNVEVLKQTTVWKSLKHCQERFDQWRDEYNTVRPHESLALELPCEHYKPSPRSMPTELPQIEQYYLENDVIRRVKRKGEIMFRNHTFGIGEAIADEPVALRQLTDHQWAVFYCWKQLGFIDLKTTTKHRNNYEKLRKRI